MTVLETWRRRVL